MVPRKRPLRATSDDAVVEMFEGLSDDVRAWMDSTPQKSDGGNGGGVTVPKWAMPIMVGLVLAVVLGVAATLTDLSARVRIIESNRFTREDATQLRLDLGGHERRLDRLEGN